MIHDLTDAAAAGYAAMFDGDFPAPGTIEHELWLNIARAVRSIPITTTPAERAAMPAPPARGDIVVFVQARLEEDRRIAQQALDEERTHPREPGQGVRYPYPERLAQIVHDGRHNARRTLLGVEAKRQILDFHLWDVDDDGIWCTHCGRPIDITDPCADLDPWPCRHIRLLAAEWSDHQEYRAEWRP